MSETGKQILGRLRAKDVVVDEEVEDVQQKQVEEQDHFPEEVGNLVQVELPLQSLDNDDALTFPNANHLFRFYCGFCSSESSTNTYTNNGIYLTNGPLWSSAFLSPEMLSPSAKISHLIPPRCLVPRITQRLLRDLSILQNEIRSPHDENRNTQARSADIVTDKELVSERERERILIRREDGNLFVKTRRSKQSQHMVSHPLYPMVYSILDLLEMNKEKHTNNDTKTTTHPSTSTSIFMKIVEDPVDYRLSQPVFPDTNIEYGGIIGQWNAATTPAQHRLGHIIKTGWHKAIEHNTLRLHLYKLHITNHPLMSTEEKLNIHIKKLYSKYKQIFKQRIISYLSYRLSALLDKLKSYSECETDDILNDSHSSATLRLLYNDLIETLPALVEIRLSLELLTQDMIRIWNQIQEIRSSQGFISTKISFKARVLKTSSTSDHITGNDNDNDNDVLSSFLPHLDEEDTAWKLYLRSYLSSSSSTSSVVKNVLERVQNVLLEADNRIREEEDDDKDDDSKNPKTTFPSIVGDNEGNKTAPVPILTKRKDKEDAREEYNRNILNESVRMLTELCDKGLIPQAVIKITNDGSITADNKLPVEEYSRRRSMQSYRFRAMIFVNGLLMMKTSFVPLITPDSLVNFNIPVEMKVLQQPMNLVIKLYLARSNFQLSSELVGEISLPIPGQQHHQPQMKTYNAHSMLSSPSATTAAAAYTPALAAGRPHWIHFSSTNTIPVPVSVQLYNNISSNEEPTSSSPSPLSLLSYMPMIEGAVLHMIEYDGLSGDDVAVIPAPYTFITDTRRRNLQQQQQLQQQRLVLNNNSRGSRGHRQKKRQTSLPGKGVGVGVGTFASPPLPPPSLFVQGEEFQSLLLPPSPTLLLLDQNDPRNETLLTSKTMTGGLLNMKELYHLSGKEKDQLLKRNNGGRGGVGTDIGNALGVGGRGHHFLQLDREILFEDTPRMKLLVLRTIRPFLFSDPIPLSDAFIKQSRHYRGLISKFSSSNELKQNISHRNTSPMMDTVTVSQGGEVAHDYDYDNDGDGEEKGIGLFDIEVKKQKVSDFLTRVRESNVVLSRTSRKKALVTSTVVDDRVLAQYESIDLGKFLVQFLVPPPKRALKPAPRERTAELVDVRRCDVLVQVVSAKHVPLRTAEDGIGDQRKSKLDASAKKKKKNRDLGRTQNPNRGDAVEMGRDKRRARTFVEIKFQDSSSRTTTVDHGPHIWKQSLKLPFQPPQNAFTTAALSSIADELHFSLFDEKIEDDSHRPVNTLLTCSFSLTFSSYLCTYSFSIPFSTICSQGRIEGTFRLDCPPFNLGYEEKSATGRFANTSVESSSNNNNNNATAQNTGHGFSSTMNRIYAMVTSIGNNNINNAAEATNFIDAPTLSELDWFCVVPEVPSITLMATLDPLLVPPATALTDLLLSEKLSVTSVISADRFLLAHAKSWLCNLRNLGRHTQTRPYRIFGLNSDGLGVFLSRFLTPIRPPKGMLSRRACIHLTFLGELDLWCSNTQVWNILAGDEEEHAITLYNFLYYLNKNKSESTNQRRKDTIDATAAGTSNHRNRRGKDQTNDDAPAPSHALEDSNSCDLYLVLGRALPEGETVYILVRKANANTNTDVTTPSTLINADNFLLINPTQGYVYGAADPSCPVIDIACLATPHNIWANVQTTGKPSAMNFNLLNTRHWRPFFGHRFPFPTTGLDTIQREVDFFITPQEKVREIGDAVRDAIKLNFRRWRIKRRRFKTVFHVDSSMEIQKLLPVLEDWKRFGDGKRNAQQQSAAAAGGNGNSNGNDSDDGNGNGFKFSGSALQAIQKEIRIRLKSLLRTNVVRGFPLNFAFTDVDGVLERVKSLCVHESSHPEAQFILAVRAFPLVQGLVSLWVFLGTLEGSPGRNNNSLDLSNAGGGGTF
eukprot:gene1440-2773_t